MSGLLFAGMVAACLWALRHIIREVLIHIAALRTPAPTTSSELVCVTSGCHTVATDLVETPAGRILPRCGRCAEEMEARGMTV